MPFGLLTKRMIETIKPFIEGVTVYDLGAGDGEHARVLLLECNPKEIVMIEKEQFGTRFTNRPGANDPRLRTVTGYFMRLPIPEEFDVAFVSWPVSYETPGLVSWLTHAKTVIYLGRNDYVTACGSVEFWQHMSGRQLRGFVDHPRNSLIVVGEPLPKGESRILIAEETRAFEAAKFGL